MSTGTVYHRLGLRRFINARGTITTLGGSIMPPEVVDAMAEASRQFVLLDELHEKAGARIARLTGAEGAFICAGAASGMFLAGAACLTGEDPEAIRSIPDTGNRPNEFVISLVDGHYYIHQGYRVCGGTLVTVGTRESVSGQDYADGISERTAACVFFLGSQPRRQLPEIIEVSHARGVPVIVDAAAQLPPRANLTELTAMGADLVVFSGGKGLCGPQSTGLILGREDLVRACRLNSNPHSAAGRGMKVGKEEICGLLRAVELFFEQDEEAVIAEWVRRCHLIAEAATGFPGIELDYQPPFTNQFPPASPLVRLAFGSKAPKTACEVVRELEAGEPPVIAGYVQNAVSFGPQTLQNGEAEIIAARLREILSCQGASG